MLLPGACWPIRALSLLLEHHCVARSCPLDCYLYNHLRYAQKHSEKWTCHINLSWGCQDNNSQWCTFTVHLPVPGSVLTTWHLLAPLILTMILLRQWSLSQMDEDGWRTDPKGLPVIPHKGNGGVGSSDSDRSEFKAFALCCNSILPLYAKHTQKKTRKRIKWGLFLSLYKNQRERTW